MISSQYDRRTRKYLYEISDPTKIIMNNLKELECKYHIFANVNVNNASKILGFIYFKNAKTLNAAKNMLCLNLAEIIPAKEHTETIQTKYKTFDNYWETGCLPLQGKRIAACKETELVVINNAQPVDPSLNNMPITAVILEQNLSLIEHSKDICNYLMKQNQQLLEENKQLKKTPTIITNNIKNTNIENKTVNVNLFLNEDCKDAVTLAEFINTLKIEDADLFCAKEYGLAEAITKIFERGLSNCDINTRPLHCTDSKRETLHIKEQDGWIRESGHESKRMKNAINTISNKNISKLSEYMKEHPEFNNTSSPKYEECLKMMRGVMGADEDSDKTGKRVIKNIVKSVYINGK